MDNYINRLNLAEQAVAGQNREASQSTVAYISPKGNFYVTDHAIDMNYTRHAKLISKAA